jgi:hypothetical protein
MSTPGGQRGHFFTHWVSGNLEWKRIFLPISANPRVDREQVEKLRRRTPPYRWQQEYECAFVGGADQLFSEQLIQSSLDPAVLPLWTPQEAAKIFGVGQTYGH